MLGVAAVIVLLALLSKCSIAYSPCGYGYARRVGTSMAIGSCAEGSRDTSGVIHTDTPTDITVKTDDSPSAILRTASKGFGSNSNSAGVPAATSAKKGVRSEAKRKVRVYSPVLCAFISDRPRNPAGCWLSLSTRR
jgi:hypothetical protein